MCYIKCGMVFFLTSLEYLIYLKSRRVGLQLNISEAVLAGWDDHYQWE